MKILAVDQRDVGFPENVWDDIGILRFAGSSKMKKRLKRKEMDVAELFHLTNDLLHFLVDRFRLNPMVCFD